MTAKPRLTALAHGGGCGCKLSPALLHDLLHGLAPAMNDFPGLLVGTETSDDAAVFRLNGTQALVATTDFFTPIVDDAYDFGRIAAANALSDVYAMGGTPLFALAVLGMPLGKLPVESVREILAGGASICAKAGIPVAGGHSIDSAEPIYGLVALGTVHPEKVLRNSGAKDGDALILTKAIGVGIYSAALKKEGLKPEFYEAMLASTTQLNDTGGNLAEADGVHAATDVTGFGVLGHALEMASGSGLRLRIDHGAVPLLPGVEQLALDGIATGAATRNWESYGALVTRPASLADHWRMMLCDPQTSGGLLIAVAPEGASALLGRLKRRGFDNANIIGRFEAGTAGIAIA
jgi:selenide,water dikinase